MKAKAWAVGLLVLAGCSGGGSPAQPAQQERELIEGPPARTPYTTPITNRDCVRWEGFKVTGSHKGGFERCEGFMSFGPEDDLRAVEVTVDVTSIFSDNDKLTGHLLSHDFFTAENYPQAHFKSLVVRPMPGEDGGRRYEVDGAMTIKGVTQEITVQAEVRRVGDEWVGAAAFALPRFDYGMYYKGRPDDLIRDEADVVVELRAPYDPKGLVAEEMGE
jgi:polyisoprenoid-binding protein YceI